jgi:CheY-like chemotaxis protein/nitrogen-specific signal transduction histidine kinase
VTHSRPSKQAQDTDTPTGSIDPVVAAITHELRTPLQAIIGFSQLALMDWPEGVDPRYLTHIDQASRLMLRVVNDLLDLHHLEHGTLEIDHDQALDLHALLLQVLDSADGLRMDKPVRLYANVDEACPRHLRGDGKRIEQVLLNLLANAIRFTDQGEVVVSARRMSQSPGDITLRLSVADTGVGLHPQVLESLSQPVEMARRQSKPQRGGSGFGLNIVRRLLALHGTELKAASMQGGGTLMWFDITLACHNPTAHAQAPEPAPDALVITQDERLFHTVRTQWAAQGQTVSLAASPEQARCAASRWVIDASLPLAPAWYARARALGCQAWLVQALPLEGEPSGPTHLALPRLAQAIFRAPRQHAASDPALRGMRVLVVEDNLLNQRVMRDQLGRMGVECGMAESGASAKACLAEGHWDAALLDMQLPDMSGLSLAHWMRQQHATYKLPFVFLSAHLSADDRLAAEVLGARACLLKPHDPQALQKLLLEMRPAHLSPPGRQRTQAGLQALSTLDTRQLMRSEWPSLRLGLQLAEDTASLRKAVHALRGSLAILGHSPALAQARVLEEGLLAGVAPEPAALLAFMSSIEDMLSESPPNPG